MAASGIEAAFRILEGRWKMMIIFHLFDRVTLAPAGSFQGNVTAHTDGVALHAASTPRFPGGALYAVHDDKSVTAFDLGDVVRTLGLAQDCVQ